VRSWACQVSPLPKQEQDTWTTLHEAKKLKQVEGVLQMQREGTLCPHLPKYYSKQWLWPWPIRPVPARSATPQGNKAKMTSYPRTRLRIKQRQEITRNGVANKDKSRIFYAHRQKGHKGKGWQNGSIPKLNLVHYDFNKLRNDKNRTCAMREISSPQTSIRAIWVPKNIVTNPIGPKKCWVLRNACWACRLKEMHDYMARRYVHHFWPSDHVKG
jgi:hypothetical protein